MATLQSRIADLITDLGTDYKAIVASIKAVTINSQSGTSYTLVLGDAGEAVECNNGSAITLTVPPNSSVAFPVGTVIEIVQLGAGAVTITPGSGVTINSRGAVLKTSGQYAMAYLRKRATDTWIATGDLTS